MMILVVPPPLGAAGVGCVISGFFKSCAQGLRPCRGGSGPVSGALRVAGLVGGVSGFLGHVPDVWVVSSLVSTRPALSVLLSGIT